ncbi:MAG: hypothetical protein ACE5OZ_17765 [Candidatus Heimdallarchaeota archaeon]
MKDLKKTSKDASGPLAGNQLFQEKILAPIEATHENLRSVMALNTLLLGALPQTRETLLKKLANLSRTFYHTHIVSYLRMSSVATDTFKEEFIRAYWRGVTERKRLIPKIEEDLSQCRDFFDKEENLRRNRGVLEGSFLDGPSPRTKIQENAKAHLSTSDDPGEHEKIVELEKNALEFIDHAEDAIQRCRLLHVDFIEPLMKCLELEINGIQKIVDALEVPRQTPSRQRVELGDLARTADVLSWGLQEFDMDAHLEEGQKELQILRETTVSRLEKASSRLKMN